MNENIILQESYFGKDETLLECENCIQALKDAVANNKNPNGVPEKTKFENLIAKKFNCEKVYFSIIADERGMNAYTMPFYYEKNRSYNDSFFELVSDSSGIRYKSSVGKTLYIYTNSYTIRNYNIESIMAVLLHEIGHNFFFIKEEIQNRKAKVFTELVLYLLQLLDYYNYDPNLTVEVVKVLIQEGISFKQGLQYTTYEQTKKFLTDKAHDIVNQKYKSDHTGIGKLFYTLSTVSKKLLTSGFRLAKTVFYTLFLPIIINSASYKELSKQEKKGKGYTNERFADNFAASYGYAKGVVATFNNTDDLSYKRKITSKIPLIRILDYYHEVLFDFVKYMNDEHPTDRKRIIFTLEKLKYELNNNRKNMSPKQIEEIENDIEAIEKLLKKTPYFRKAINSLFSNMERKRDIAGSIDVSDQEIYDFDTNLLKDKIEIRKEDLGIEYYMTENFSEALNEYYESPVMEILSE